MSRTTTLYLELGAHGDELLFEVVGAEVEGVEHLGELDVLEDLGVDPLRVLLLELEPHHLHREVPGEPGHLNDIDDFCELTLRATVPIIRPLQRTIYIFIHTFSVFTYSASRSSVGEVLVRDSCNLWERIL